MVPEMVPPIASHDWVGASSFVLRASGGPMHEFGPDISRGLDDNERMALLGTVGVCAGIIIALICGIFWLTNRVQSAARRYRR